MLKTTEGKGAVLEHCQALLHMRLMMCIYIYCIRVSLLSFQIIQTGHSRIPVYDLDRTNIVGCLLTKTLIKLDPDDAVSVSSLVHDGRYGRPPMFIDSDQPLFDLLNTFQTGKSETTYLRCTSCSSCLFNTEIYFCSKYYFESMQLLNLKEKPIHLRLQDKYIINIDFNTSEIQIWCND